jgi:diacylglycerol kinase family enzyme
MGVLYAGTSPDFCRFHGLPTEPAAALAGLVEGRSKPVDAVRIGYADAGGGARVAHFGCSCNVGLGAAVARFANRWRKVLGDGLGTGLAVLRAIVRAAPVDLELDVDGERLTLPCVNNLSILKNPYLASGLRLNAELRPDDGRLVLAVVHGKSPAGLCAVLPGFYSGRAAASDAVYMKLCARVIIRASGPAEIEFDGDPRGFLPAEIRILPRAVELIGAADERG